MKKFIFYTALILLCGCHTPKTLTLQETSNVENWKIPETEAREMIGRLNSCGLFKRCRDDSKIIDLNNDKYVALVTAYGKENVSMIDARYKQEHRLRYCELRGFDDHRNCKVRGYKTQIVKVELPTGSMFAVTNYYDIYTIQPPPYD